VHSGDVFKFAVVALLFSQLWLAAQAQDALPTNLQVIEGQLASLISQAGAALYSDSCGAVVLQEEISHHPLNAFVNKQFVQWAKARGFSAIYQGAAEGYSALRHDTFRYMPVQVQVQYQRSDSSGSALRRRVTVEVYFSLQHASGKIVFSENLLAHYQDVVREKETRSLETPALAFTHGERPASGIIATLLQPVVVAITTAGVIYSFYSFRSR